ncbi:DUF3231 family protein [Clostridium sp. CS001]|uniref:DUF3231 family protein n=1 Tax=Clostridium sp. CS001 TaxID=2880648 RepID=UPI001CF1DE8F|nr:DUF3231 family protein [Clostridium sp. CS001]MCB2288547.1 DUF3231 family protein [Clostridium sp. CS001]
MPDSKNIPLVSSEISGLWNSYMSDSLAIRVLSYFLNNVEDNETRELIQYTINLSIQHSAVITDLFNKEGLPIPDGFTDNDVNVNAPRLFTDSFHLAYLTIMARLGMCNYTSILNQTARKDVRDYFSKCINDCVELYNKSTDLRLSKGVFVRAPQIEVSKEVEYIKSDKFLLDFFGEKRPLLAREITRMFELIFTNTMAVALTTAFAQVSKDKKISNCLFKGKDLSSKILGELTKTFLDEGIPASSTSESYVTDSTESPFSEKLMLIYVLIMTTSSISNMGMAISESSRGDLITKYIKYGEEIMNYAKQCSDILIDNKWLEQPPQVIKHEDL